MDANSILPHAFLSMWLTAIAGKRDSRAARRGFPGFNPFSPPEPTCSIDGATVAANTPNPANSCQFCDPGLDANGWSPAFGAFCGDGSQVCCDGDCVYSNCNNSSSSARGGCGSSARFPWAA